jgi:uncharacterized membrane protein
MTMNQKTEWTDQRIEVIIGNLLRLGVIVASVTVFTGGVFFMIGHGLDTPHFQLFRGEASKLRSIESVLTEMRTLRSRAVMQLGILLLILTPVARVAFSIFAFHKEKDNLYVLISSIVLAFLLFSLFSGVAIK